MSSAEITPDNNINNPKSLSDTAVHTDLVDNPIPYKETTDTKSTDKGGNNKSKTLDEKHKQDIEEILKNKKLSECDGDELTKIMGREKQFTFLLVNDDGTYSKITKTRKTMNNRIIRKINDVGMMAANFISIGDKKKLQDVKSAYNNLYYIEYDGIKFFNQNQLFDYYFKLICMYSFGFKLDDFDNHAVEDVEDEIDNNKAFCYKTLARIAMELGQYGWAFFLKR